MMRSQHRGAVVIVEGDTDARVYKRFINRDICVIIPSLGKTNATGALKMLERDKCKGILIIVDNDFWVLDGITPESPNLLTTDTHDLETMILSSSALEKVIDEFGSEKKINRTRKSIRDILLELGMPLGFFRWIYSSQHEKMTVRFKNISLEEFIRIDRDTITINIDNLVKEVRNNTPQCTLDSKETAIRIKELLRNKTLYDPWHVCRGHDLVHILTVILKKGFGKRKVKNITLEIIDGMLRIAYEYRDFSKTKLFASIKKWEKANSDFRILAAN